MYDTVTRGLSQIKEELNRQPAGTFGWFKLKGNGSSAIVRFLFKDDQDQNLIAVWEHALRGRSEPPYHVTCLGKETCPICAQGNRPSLQVYIPLFVYDEAAKMEQGDDKARPIMIWKRGKRDTTTLLGLIQEYGDLTARDFKITRTGTTMENTAYHIFPKDASPFRYADYVAERLPGVIESVLNMVAKKTREEVITLMNGGSLRQQQDNVIPTQPPKNDDDLPF